MSNQETPVKDKEEPLSEEPSESVKTLERSENAPEPEPAATSPGEQARPTMPPPYIPPAQPPYTWQGYYPGTGPQWARGGQYGPQYPYPARKRSQWPWIVLTFVLLFMLHGRGYYRAGWQGQCPFAAEKQPLPSIRRHKLDTTNKKRVYSYKSKKHSYQSLIGST